MGHDPEPIYAVRTVTRLVRRRVRKRVVVGWWLDCQQCGERFRAVMRRRRWCSDACKLRAARARARGE